MIFKTLFRPKYQDPNPHVRLKAIESLSPEEPAHKTQLHELAFNDEHAGVSLAALSKLNSFALWSKMAQIARDEKVRKRAQSKVEEALFAQDSQLSEQEKRTYLLESNTNSLLEKALRSGIAQSDDAELSMALLKKLNKPHLTKQILLNEASEALQLGLLPELDDEATLQKLVKKGRSEHVFKQAQNRLTELEQAKQKPLKIAVDARMLLSRLLALKENSDYEKIAAHRQVLEQTFAELKQEFDCLTEAKRDELIGKHADISKKLDTWFAQLAPQWQAQKQDEQKQALFDQLYADSSDFLTAFAKTLADAASVSEQQVQTFTTDIQKLKQALDTGLSEFSAATPNRVKLEATYNKLIASEASLGRLPAFQAAIGEGKAFLTKFSELTEPSDVSQLDAAQAYLKEQTDAWFEIKRDFKTQWPDAMEQNWLARKQHWQTAIKQLRDGLYQEVSRCRGKLRALDNLVQQGKFRSAMGLYEKVQVAYTELPEKQQTQLQKLFEKAKEQIENLRDWQAYIAQPRKPAILAEAEALASNPVDIEDQAEQVKLLRKQWNSLGKLDTEADQALNQAFDKAIEEAFAPCRKHYSELQHKRAENLAAKQALIRQLEQIDVDSVEVKSLATLVREKQQAWQNAGEVDYRELEALNKRYRDVQKPLKDILNRYYADNAEQKSGLVKQAEALLELEDTYQAAEQAKQLQQKWRQIEHAGRKQEGALWKAFRKVNDEVFARRQSQIDEANKETKDKLASIQPLLDEMRAAIQQASDKAALSQALGRQTELQNLIDALPDKAKDKPMRTLQILVEQHGEKLFETEKLQVRQQYISLFEALRSWTTDEKPDVSHLASSWQNYFTAKQQKQDRHELTLMMEIISSQASPKEDQEKRKQVQLKMLANKLQQGGHMKLDDLLKSWVGQGSLSETDLTLLARIQALY